ncbi:preprotein translocase subunit SecE [Gordonia sp. CPCC 205515]|uniref:preprotein translocase subunit SecE n=1 Tax=Gordonia sp. CPCC 205515 TaxID=3140791 RepID=UPI003AF3ABFB
MSKRDRASAAKDAAEDTAAEKAGEELEVRADDAEDTELRPSGKRSSRGRRSSTSASTTDGDADSDKGSVAVKERKKASAGESRNPFVRIWTFLKQVVAELKKVIWPTRREMITYTIVVLIFVIVMTAFISGIDLGFAKLILWAFG